MSWTLHEWDHMLQAKCPRLVDVLLPYFRFCHCKGFDPTVGKVVEAIYCQNLFVSFVTPGEDPTEIHGVYEVRRARPQQMNEKVARVSRTNDRVSFYVSSPGARSSSRERERLSRVVIANSNPK